MKKILFFILSVSLLLPQSVVFAQEVEEGQSLPVATQPSAETSEPTGNVSCFDYYRFGSVSADLQPGLAQTVPGVSLYFKGMVKNDNDYPLVNGTVYVKIFRRDDGTFKEGNGNPVVDEFALEQKFNLPAKGEKEASFEWRVPNNAPAGDYYAATFFATENRYNLMGLSFTDDVVGNMAQFSVTAPNAVPAAGFSKNGTMLNGKQHAYAAFPLHFGAGEAVEVKVKLVNPDQNPKVMPVIWKEYAWDALRPENQRNQRYEMVEVPGSSTKELSYTVKPGNDAVSYLVVETKDQDLKSFLNVRLVRDGVQETRINFPSILKYPLKAGEANALFACAHSTNEPLVNGNTMVLTLRDGSGQTVHSYKYQGDIAGAMSGWKDDFTPETFLANFTLTATLERDGRVMEEVNIKYDCNEIDPNLCEEPAKAAGSDLLSGGKGMAIGLIAILSLVGIMAIVIAKIRRGRRRSF